jgi:hypothetical protein
MVHKDTPPSELEELRREVRELRKELALLRRFIRVTPAEEGIPPSAQVRCSSLILVTRGCNPEKQAILEATSTGGALAIMGEKGASRLELSASSMVLRGSNGSEAVEICAEPETNRGSVLVFEDGGPRAVIKAAANGGCVSVLHDDGSPRGSLVSTEHHGADLLMVTPDLKPGVRISSGAPNGGLISVHRTNGSPAVSLMCGQTAAGVAIRKSNGKVRTIT